MIFTLLFTAEMIFLFFLSKKLITSLSRIFGIRPLAIIFLPGTIIHELSHLLTAGILLVPVGEMTIWPEIEGNSVKLGSVQVGHVDPFRLTIVGVAPVIWGGLSILGIIYFAQSSNFNVWENALGLYLIFTISNSMFSSKKDVEGTIYLAIILLILSLATFLSLYFLSPSLLTNFGNYLATLNLAPLAEFFKLASKYLLIPLFLDLFIILLTSLLIRRH